MQTEIEKVCHDYSTIEELIYHKISTNVQERSFYILDMCDIYQKHLKWLELMPRVKPYYAVKCNNMPKIIDFLAKLGTNFDCASKAEIEQVLACGVDPTQIIYANPCKTKSFIRHAYQKGVDLMTFDNDLELHKIAQLHPRAKLVIRIKGDDRSSRCKFNIKFGADIDRTYDLLKLAKQLNLSVVGVSFHNGSDCEDSAAFFKSIENAKMVFDIGNEIGHNMSLLDIGGGFPGDQLAKISFEEIAAMVNRALDVYFPPSSGVEVMAEPGRYYVASSMTLCTMVIAKKAEVDEKSGQSALIYYLNDGVYGAFNNIIYEHATPEPSLLSGSPATSADRKMFPSVMWGPTCDSVDCIKRDFHFPELEVGEWLVFKNMGAYTCCVATTFNGFEKASVIVANQLMPKRTYPLF